MDDYFTFLLRILSSEAGCMKVKVWQIRKAKGITLKQLEKLSGIGKTTINNIENGVTSPTLLQMEKIARAMNVRITDLFDSDYK